MDYQIIISENGFEVFRLYHDFRLQTRTELKYAVLFGKIIEIEAYISTEISERQIFLSFSCSDGIVYSVHDRMDHFDRLLSEIENRFPSQFPEWKDKLSETSEEKRTLLYTKL